MADRPNRPNRPIGTEVNERTVVNFRSVPQDDALIARDPGQGRGKRANKTLRKN
jgi:hypothetical protein